MKDDFHHLSDEQLVTTFLQGKENAFRQLVERHQNFLLNYLFRFTGSREIAEEITQETFMAMFQNLAKFRPNSSFRAWIYAIATNRALNSRRRRSPLFCDEMIEQASDGKNQPLACASEQERAAAVKEAMGRLPEKQRAIFIMRFYQRLSYEEIAVAIGCPVGTVKSRMCYALKRMRGILWSHREEK